MSESEKATSDIIVDITSSDLTVVQRGLLNAFFLLEENARAHRAHDDAHAIDYLRTEYKRYAERGAFDSKYVGVSLTDAQIDRILHAVLSLFDRRDPSLTCNAIAAAAVSGRLWVIPVLESLVREHAILSTPVARDAIQAIGKLLRDSGLGEGSIAGSYNERLVRDAVATLRYAASVGPAGVLSAREQAEFELERLTKAE